MSRYQLAQLNIATMKESLESPSMADFVANLERINALAEASPGFVWRLQDEAGDAPPPAPSASRCWSTCRSGRTLNRCTATPSAPLTSS